MSRPGSQRFVDLPIRTKLLLVVGGTSAVAVLLATLAISGYDLVQYRRSLVRELTVTADLLGFNSSAALLFNDPVAASQVLEPLRAEPSVLGATIYSRDGAVLQTYRSDGGSSPVEPIAHVDAVGYHFDEVRLHLRRPIVFEGEEIGVLWVEAHADNWLTHLAGYWVVVGPVALIAILGALLLALRFQRLITGPISDLASMARRVSEDDDLSIRCREIGNDEVGLLAGAFNDMLDRIQEQGTSMRVHVRALRESEERLLRLSDATHEGIVIHDDDLIIDANHAFLMFVGRGRSDVIGASILDFWDSETLPLVVDRMRSPSSLPYEASLVRNDATIVPMEIRGRPLPLDGKPARVMILRDLSDVRRTEEALRDSENQLRKAQKMEAVGQLAAGVAHDFNNLLTVIGGNGEMILDGLEGDDPLREEVESICKAAASAASLTRQLLAFSRQQVLQPRVLDMNEAVHDLEPMLRTILGETIEMTIAHAPGCAQVQIDPGQLEQVIVNLVVNAHDAMSGGGRLTIDVDSIVIDGSGGWEPQGLEAGQYVRLAISDNGVGMDDRTKSRLFEPFFTTKGPGKGTGLGLATVYGIVKQSGGYVEATSELGLGTTLTIYLPAVEGARSGADGVGETAVLDGAETILLVEDNPAVRSLARRVLYRAGYTVLEAVDGEEAVLVSDRYGGHIDLVLSDVVMPRLSGPKAVERLMETRPNVKVLYMSGYTDDAIGQHGVLAPDVHFLQKPFSPAALGEKVREVLDGAGAAPRYSAPRGS